MEALAGVLFKMDAVEKDIPIAGGGPDADPSSYANRGRVLADLYPFGGSG